MLSTSLPSRQTELFSMNNMDERDRKLFVGGLPHDCCSEVLRSCFDRFGEVLFAEVLRDKVTTNSRGFGFVTFADEAAASRAAAQGAKGLSIQGKHVEIKFAVPRVPPAQYQGQNLIGNNFGFKTSNFGSVHGNDMKMAWPNDSGHGASVRSAARGETDYGFGAGNYVRSSSMYTSGVTGGLNKMQTINEVSRPLDSWLFQDKSMEGQTHVDFSPHSAESSISTLSGHGNNLYGVESAMAPRISRIRSAPMVNLRRESSGDSYTGAVTQFGYVSDFDTVYSSGNGPGVDIFDNGEMRGCASSTKAEDEFKLMPNKVFVGGLLYSTGHESLRRYFEQFGQIESAEVIYNRETKKSRGFGFVIFQHYTAVEKIMCRQALERLTIDGKPIEIKPCRPKEHLPPKAGDYDNVLSGGCHQFAQVNMSYLGVKAHALPVEWLGSHDQFKRRQPLSYASGQALTHGFNSQGYLNVACNSFSEESFLDEDFMFHS